MRYPSEFQRKVFNTLAILGLSQVQINREPNGTFHIRTSDSCWKRFFYFVLRTNAFFKLLYLILLACGFFQEEFEFFEKMAILLWFLIFGLVSISERIFFKKYPFFEILTAWWKVEESIYNRLGKPKKLLKDLRWMALWRVWFQGIIALVGVLAVIIQYDAAPKYCVFAYSLFEQEDEMLKWIVGTHEVLFLAYAWIVYGSVIYLSAVIGAEFTYNIDALQEVMEMFVQHGYYDRQQEDPVYHSNQDQKYISSSRSARRKRLSRSLSQIDNPIFDDGSLITMTRVWYNPTTLLKEYLHVNMVVTQLNNFAAYDFLYMHGCSYVQMVSDVFQMIQILRSAEADFLAVVFFAEDMMVCMYMLFRCFKSMAFLHPSSVSFRETFHNFLAGRRGPSQADRCLLQRLKRTLRTTAFKLGPSQVGPWTVGIAMDVLLQYYICVALW